MSHTKYVFVANEDGVKQTVAANTITVIENDAAQADNGAALVAGDTFQIVESRYGTPVFKQADIIKVDATPYAAGTSQVLQVTPAIETDGSAYIKLIDVTDGREKFAIATFEAVGAADAAAAVDQLVLAINASKRDVFKDVTAAENSGDATIIDITVPVGSIFRGAANDASSAVTEDTAPVLPVGTEAALNAEFEDGLPFLGVTNIAGPNVVKPASGASGNYHRVSIAVQAEVGDRTDLHEIVIYVKDSANDTLIGHLSTVFASNAPGTISLS